MRFAFLVVPLAVSAALSRPAVASERSFVYSQESRVLAPGESELEPWTTFRVGRERYFSAIDGRLELEHGVAPGLQLALYWNFSTQTQDVLQDSLTRELARVSESEFASASLELKYQLSDPSADVLGSALYLETTLGPRESEVEARVIVDRSIGKWLVAANLVAELELEPRRDADGSELESTFVLEPTVGAGYQFAHGSIGLELRAPLGLAGEAESATLFGGPSPAFPTAAFGWRWASSHSSPHSPAAAPAAGSI